MLKSHKKPKSYLQTELVEQKGRQYIVPVQSQQNKLVSGKFSSYSMNDELMIYCSDAIELDSAQIIAQCNAALYITVLFEGEIHFGYDDMQLNLQQQQYNVAVVNLTQPCMFHKTLTAKQKVKKLNIIISPRWFEKRVALGCHIQHLISTHKFCQILKIESTQLQKIAELMFFKPELGLLQKLSYELKIYQILIDILQQLPYQAGTADNALTQQTTHTGLEKLLAFIEANLNDPLDLTMLATQSAMSPSTLQRKFKTQMGCTVVNYIRERRLLRAKQLIERRSLSVSAAAYEAGYKHPANFSIAFRRKFGYAPINLLTEDP